MKKARKNKHLTMEDRVTIEVLAGAGLSFSAIARRIGKDRTTVAKEVRARRYRVGKGASPSNLRTEEKPEARPPQ